jgi:putative transposase
MAWLNQVERWFSLITQRAIRRGSFSSVKDLIKKIGSFVQHYNRSHRPFVWTAKADSILQKISRLCSVISGTRHTRDRSEDRHAKSAFKSVT